MKKHLATTGICAAATAAALAAAVAVPAAAWADPAPAPTDVATKLIGKTVFLDPGHQGTNHNENLDRPVDDGRGGTKPCQTTGMTSLNGVPEHTINWDVAQLVKASLETLGAKVVLSRADDAGWGGCVDERAKAASNSGAEVAVSIHADSAPAQDHGFHLIVPTLPIPNQTVNAVQSGRGLDFSKTMRDAYVKSGFSPANYAGVQDGLQTRADIAGPALTTVPLAFVEMGNGANADDAKLLETKDGQIKQALAITTGIAGYLLGIRPPDANASAPQPGTQARALPASPAATPAPLAATAPQTSTPKSAATTTPGVDTQNGLATTVMQLLKPLAEALGLGDTGSSDAGSSYDTLSDMASALLDVLMQSGLLGGAK